MTESQRSHAKTNGDARKKVEPALRAVADTAAELRRLDELLVERVRERPLAAAAVALAAGYLVGRMFSRWG